jgi:hypothetical protein
MSLSFVKSMVVATLLAADFERVLCGGFSSTLMISGRVRFFDEESIIDAPSLWENNATAPIFHVAPATKNLSTNNVSHETSLDRTSGCFKESREPLQGVGRAANVNVLQGLTLVFLPPAKSQQRESDTK